jgi:hypothetical protein
VNPALVPQSRERGKCVELAGQRVGAGSVGDEDDYGHALT